MIPQPGDLVEINVMIPTHSWPFGLVLEEAPDGRLYVAMVGDHVNRNMSGARIWRREDLIVVCRTRETPTKGDAGR